MIYLITPTVFDDYIQEWFIIIHIYIILSNGTIKC